MRITSIYYYYSQILHFFSSRHLEQTLMERLTTASIIIENVDIIYAIANQRDEKRRRARQNNLENI